MPDSLNDFERIQSWIAAWNPSFDGWAIVDKDFKFRSVNQQFCDICGVTPAELIGQSFKDLTPVHIRALDVQNARLIMEGKIKSYLLPKSYEFLSGHRVEILLLVVGVYHPETKEFMHFVSRILEHPPETISLGNGVTHTSPLLKVFTELTSIKSRWSIILWLAGCISAIIYLVLQKLGYVPEL